MPELPEVETIRRHLAGPLAGALVRRVTVTDPTVTAAGSAPLDGLAGKVIARLGRHGKLLLLHTGDGWLLTVHLRMTGNLLLSGDPLPRPHERFQALVQRPGDDPLVLHFTDPRRFGRMALLPGAGGASNPAGCGPDALSLGSAAFAAILRSTRRGVKALLLDQRALAGIGNIYADEALHRARVHPASPAADLSAARAVELHRAMVGVLEEALAAGGSSVRDYRTPCGDHGRFQESHAVYRRQGLPCPDCGATIRRTVVAGRGTHACPRCQPLPRRRKPRAGGG